jgi:hypothetical protein
MPEPMDAPFSKLAKDVGASEQEIERVPPEVKRLTHGQLLALWGVDNDEAAIAAYRRSQAQEGGLLSPLKIVEQIGDAALAPLHLKLSDISSIQTLFTPARVRSTISRAGFAEPELSISCCCCSPCCCCCMVAMDPGKAVVAP